MNYTGFKIRLICNHYNNINNNNNDKTHEINANHMIHVGGRYAQSSGSQVGGRADSVSGTGFRVGVQRIRVGRQAEGAARLHAEVTGCGGPEQQVARSA